jgi:hypothetical protein
MKYHVTYNRYDTKLNVAHDICKTFNSLAAAIEFISKLNKLKEWETVSITAEK